MSKEKLLVAHGFAVNGLTGPDKLFTGRWRWNSGRKNWKNNNENAVWLMAFFEEELKEGHLAGRAGSRKHAFP